jgi:POT family proton-dependent oligopeptide transporter
MDTEKTLFGHPRGLFVLFFTEMWERFSYYGMRAILFLYLTKSISEGALGLPEDVGGAVYGLYAAAVYLLTLPGGWIADNVLGQKKAILWGGICIMIGHAIWQFLALPKYFSRDWRLLPSERDS